eukprot:COSAG02_NODE_62731_length_265_cov_0.620482_1_plen_74_part_10
MRAIDVVTCQCRAAERMPPKRQISPARVGGSSPELAHDELCRVFSNPVASQRARDDLPEPEPEPEPGNPVVVTP